MKLLKNKITITTLLFFVITINIYSQNFDSTSSSNQIDTTKIVYPISCESETHSYSDTTIIFQDLPELQTKNIISDSTIKFSFYQDLKEILYKFSGINIYELGPFGYNHGIMINYLDNRSFELMQNSIITNDPFLGNIDINNYPVEDISKIEYINNSKAFLYGFNSNSGVINLINKNFNTPKPYTKIRYSESAYEETSLDGIFSQNIKSNWNITLGIRRNASDGRFSNSEYDSWNLRVKTNYKIFKNLDTYFTWLFNQNKIGTNGGINLDITNVNDAFDRLKANVVNQNAYQKTSKNDLQLGMYGKFFDISDNKTTILFYLINNMYQFRDPEKSPDDIMSYIKIHTRWIGVKINQDFSFPNTILKPEIHIGTEIKSDQILQSPLLKYQKKLYKKVFADLILSPLKFLNINAFTRLINLEDTYSLDAGLITSLLVKNFLTIEMGFSNSHRFPYEAEKFLIDTQVNNSSLEKYIIKDLTFNFNPLKELNLSISYLIKERNKAIVSNKRMEQSKSKPDFLYEVFDKVDQKLINTKLKINIWKFESVTNYTYNLEDEYNDLFNIHSKHFFYNEFFYNDQFFNNNLKTKIGFRTRYYSKQNSYFYNHAFNVFYKNKDYSLGSITYVDAISFFQIGNVIANICIENIFNSKAVLIYYYPLKDRSLRIGINWVFTD